MPKLLGHLEAEIVNSLEGVALFSLFVVSSIFDCLATGRVGASLAGVPCPFVANSPDISIADFLDMQQPFRFLFRIRLFVYS